MSEGPVVLDTNVLVYAMNAEAPHHVACRALHDRAVAGEVDVRLTAQILFEYFAAVTHPGHLVGALPPDQALADVEALASTFAVLPTPPDLTERVVALLRVTGFSSRHVFDVQLAATMLANDVPQIYSYDARFSKIPGVFLLTP